MINTLYYIKI